MKSFDPHFMIDLMLYPPEMAGGGSRSPEKDLAVHANWMKQVIPLLIVACP
jgi:hypothetical protein